MTTHKRRLDKLAEHFTPVLTEDLVDRAIAALERDPRVAEIDGVPMWQIEEWINTEIARLKKEEAGDHS